MHISITIPKTVKLESYSYKIVKIDKKAFNKKTSLKTINIKATTITSMGSKAFAGIHPNATVTVPKKQYNKYQPMLKKAGLPIKATIKKKYLFSSKTFCLKKIKLTIIIKKWL